MTKDSGSHQNDTARLVWRREYDYQSELEQTRLEILKAEERALEAQKRCEELELQASIAEERFSDTVRKMTSAEVEEHIESPQDTTSSTHAALMEHVLSSKLIPFCLLFYSLLRKPHTYIRRCWPVGNIICLPSL